MTRSAVERAVRVWQRRLGLDGWDVEVEWDEPSEDGSDASTWRSASYDRATMKFAEGWPKWSREFTNRVVVHELLHLVSRDLDEVVNDLEGQLHRDAFTLVDRRYLHEIEGLVDRLAYRLVEIGGQV
jgi:hypothetical protein